MKFLLTLIILLYPTIGIAQQFSLPSEEELSSVITSEEKAVTNYEAFLTKNSLMIDSSIVEKNKVIINVIRKEIASYKKDGDSAVLLVQMLSSIDDLTLAASVTRSNIVYNAIQHTTNNKKYIEIANSIMDNQDELIKSAGEIANITLKYVEAEENILIETISKDKNNS